MIKALLVTLLAISLFIISTSCGGSDPSSIRQAAESITTIQGTEIKIYTYHDDVRNVTCWVAHNTTSSRSAAEIGVGIGISCIPDTLLVGR